MNFEEEKWIKVTWLNIYFLKLLFSVRLTKVKEEKKKTKLDVLHEFKLLHSICQISGNLKTMKR